MCKIICVTNRRLCRGDFIRRIQKIAAAGPEAIILREKDLPQNEYTELASKVISACREFETPIILHTHHTAARELAVRRLHMPLPLLSGDYDRSFFTSLGASCHSADEAEAAQSLGCTYIIAGHIFDTDCKRGTPGRGVDFLSQICSSVKIPVYAIGGINEDNLADVLACGAAGACVMSSAMTADDPQKYIERLKAVNV